MIAQTTLYKLGKDIVREQRIEEVGGHEPQIRDRPRWEVNESIPGEKLRPGAFKMQLRPHEEAALPLVSVPCSTALPYWRHEWFCRRSDLMYRMCGGQNVQ